MSSSADLKTVVNGDIDNTRNWEITKALVSDITTAAELASALTLETPTVVGVGGGPAFSGTWTHFSSSSDQAARFYKDPFGIAYIEGIVKSGTIGTTIFTLPTGYRPPFVRRFAVMSNGVFGYATVGTDGTVTASAGNATSFSLDGITFRL